MSDNKTDNILKEEKVSEIGNSERDKDNKVKSEKRNSKSDLLVADKKIPDKKEKELKKEIKKSETKKPKKTEAVINGKDLRISTKHAVAVCNFIRNKNIEKALKELEDVSKFKKPIPMKGEIPHKKGRGIMSARYPINAVKEFIKLLKGLRANAIYNETDIEKSKIFCVSNIASRPYKRFGQSRFKRSHVQIKLIPTGKK